MISNLADDELIGSWMHNDEEDITTISGEKPENVESVINLALENLVGKYLNNQFWRIKLKK